jgi:hypothetical protein
MGAIMTRREKIAALATRGVMRAPMRIRTEARAVMHARIEALKKSAEFEPLLARLEKEVATEAAKNGKNGPTDRWALESTIIKASLMYDGVRYSVGEVSPTFHELALHARAIVEKLKDDANRHDVLVALGAPAIDDWAEQAHFNALFPDVARIRIAEEEEARERAKARHKAMLHYLDMIARAVPPPPAKSRGRPARKDLRVLVECLADYWVRATGKRITQNWHNGEPLTRFTQFLRAAAHFIDPQCIIALPKMAELIVKERRRDSHK